jgi:hypothetical protein
MDAGLKVLNTQKVLQFVASRVPIVILQRVEYAYPAWKERAW